MVCGFAALAVLSWQRTQNSRARVWTVVLGLTLAGAIAMHYYSVLLFGAFVIAELLRSQVKRSFRGPVWVAFLCGASPIIICIPLINAARNYSSHFWSKPSLGSLNSFVGSTFESVAFPLAAVIICACVVVLSSKSQTTTCDHGTVPPVPVPDLALVVAWAAVPIPAIVLALAVTGAYTHRYVISATVALCILAAWLISRLFSQRVMPAVLAVILFLAFFAVRDGRYARWPVSDRRPVAAFLEKTVQGALPIAISDPQMFFELAHQASSELRPRLMYFPDAKLAIQYTKTDTVDRGIIGMSKIAPLRVEALTDVLASKQTFVVYGFPGTFGWIVPELSARKVPMSVTGEFDGRLLLLAQPDASAASIRDSGASASSELR